MHGQEITISEFARLLVSLCDDDSLRGGWIKSKSEYTRIYQDVGAQPKYVWSAKVAPKFNNANLKPTVIFPSYIQLPIKFKFPCFERNGK